MVTIGINSCLTYIETGYNYASKNENFNKTEYLNNDNYIYVKNIIKRNIKHIFKSGNYKKLISLIFVYFPYCYILYLKMKNKDVAAQRKP